MGDATRGAASRRRATDAALVWIGQPGTLAATLLLLLNDHLLKQALPGVVTGKLSDVAGLLVAPPLLAFVLTLLTGRASDRLAAGSLLAVGLGFTLVKATAAGAELASRAWTLLLTPSQMRADPSDLIALPALVLSGWLWTRARGRPRTTLAARRARVLLAVPLAVLGTAATSAVGVRAVQSVGVWQGRVVVSEGYGSLAAGVWVTADGGVSWRHETTAMQSPSYRPTVRTAGCVPGAADHCYRVVPGQPRVEETADGGKSWSTAWQISPGRQVYWRRATARTGLFSLVGDPAAAGSVTGIAARSLVVTAVPGGYTVVVADAEAGLVVRDVSGRWQRNGFTDFDGPVPVPLTGSPGKAAGEVVLAVVAGVVAGFAGNAFDRLRRIDPRLRRRALGRVLGRPLVALGWLALVTWWCAASDTPTRTAVEMGFLSLCVLPTLALAWPAPRLGARPARSALVATASVAASVLTGLLVLIPFLGWAEGSPDSYSRACLLALAALLAGVAGCSLLAWRGAARPIPAVPRRDGGGGRHL